MLVQVVPKHFSALTRLVTVSFCENQRAAFSLNGVRIFYRALEANAKITRSRPSFGDEQ